jgi:hypothetical protein
MTDEQAPADVHQTHAAAVREAADRLNRAITAAEKAGLRVTLDARGREEMTLYNNSDGARQCVLQSASVRVEISRPL